MVNPARVRTVSNTLQHPGTASPYRPTNVTIRLNVPGFINGGTAEKIRTRYVTPDATGLWSVDLEVNADIDPAGTSYTVHEAAGIAWTFIVPPGTTPVNLRDILVVDPANPSPLVAGVPLPGSGVPAGDVWTTDGLGGGDYAPPAGGGGDVQTVAGVSPDGTGNVPLTAADVGAASAGALTSEASTRANADTTLGGLITTEAATARAAESANATAITAEATNRANAITTEAAARAAADALAIPLTQKGAANGVASLGSDGLVPTAQIPALALTTSVVVASQAAMLALTPTQVQPGDLAVRTDGAGTFILSATDPSVLGNWTRLNAPTDVVISVNGQVGTVNLGATDVGAQPVDSDLTAIAGLDATTAGVIASDGTGWFRKTYAQLKTALGLSGTNSGDQTITLTGDVTGSGTGSFAATMKNTGTAGTYGDATHAVTLTTDAQGRVTAVTTNLITGLTFTRQLKTANYAAALGDYVAADTTGGAFTVTLPAASGGKGTIVLKWVAGTLAPSVALTGSDHFDLTTGSTGGAFSLLNQAATYDSDGTSIYSVRNSFSLSTLDTRFGRVPDGRSKFGAGPSIWLSMPGVQPVGTTVFTLAPNRAQYTFLKVSSQITVDQLVVEVTTAVAASHARFAIYAATNDLQPTGAALIDSGAVDTSTTGVKTTSVTATVLSAGLYAVWTNADSSGIAVRAVQHFNPLVGYNPSLGGNAITAQTYAAQTYGAPPGTPLAWDSTASGTSTSWVFLRESVA